MPSNANLAEVAAQYGYVADIGSAREFDCVELQNLLNLWRSKCNNRAMPQRSDFTLRDLNKTASHIALVDIVEIGQQNPRYRMRLLGDYLAAVVDDVASPYLDEHEDESYKAVQSAIFGELIAKRAPLRYHGPVPQRNLSHVHTDSLILPLSENGIAPTAILVAAWFSAPQVSH